MLILLPEDATYTAFADSIFRVLEDRCLPCWSVGRLIEIMLLCHISNYTGIMFDKPLYEASNCTNIEWCITVLETSIECGNIDFSKLED